MYNNVQGKDPWDNVENSITEKMLPAAVNLYCYFKKEVMKKNKELMKKSKELEMHYQELVLLISTGIIKYANDSCVQEQEDKEQESKERAEKARKAIEEINTYLQKRKIKNIIINTTVLNGFID